MTQSNGRHKDFPPGPQDTMTLKRFSHIFLPLSNLITARQPQHGPLTGNILNSGYFNAKGGQE